MTANKVSAESLLSSVRSLLSSADADADTGALSPEALGYEWIFEERVDRYIENAFLQLLVLTEANGLGHLHGLISETYRRAKTSKEGFGAMDADENGDLFLIWRRPIKQFVDCLDAAFGITSIETVRKDVIDILRATQYAVTDKRCFENPPINEAEFHDRAECVLKCIFPDLLRKPPIAKPITNFIPDTGLPSINTLLEYKYVQSASEVGRIANEVLADTRGYTSSEWSKFIYVIYETERFKSEVEWKQLLRECGTAHNSDVIVIHGEVPSITKKTASKKHSKKA